MGAGVNRRPPVSSPEKIGYGWLPQPRSNHI